MSSTHEHGAFLDRESCERSTRRLRLGVALLLGAAGSSCLNPRSAPRALDLSLVEDLRRTEPGLVEAPARSPRQEADPDANYRAGFFAADGLYLGARTHWSVLGGDFDGNTALAGPDTIFVPDADDGRGYEFVLGWMNKGWATELSYTRITYDGSIGAAPADIEYQAITWNGMRYLRANEPLQPYFLVGLVFPWMDLEDASTNGGPFGDAELSNGLGLNAGLGLAWWFGPHLALDVRSLFTYQFFEEAEGVSGNSGTIDDGVDGPSFGLSFGLTWALGKANQDGGS